MTTPGQKKAAQAAVGILTMFVLALITGEEYVGGGSSGTIAGVLLGEPLNMSVVDTSTNTIQFCFYPTIYNGTFYKAELWTNETGSWALEETNTSELSNNTLFCFNHTISTW